MSEWDKMQTDAVNRAREMYSRRSPPYVAGGFPSGYNGSMKPNASGTAERKHVSESDKTPNSENTAAVTEDETFDEKESETENSKECDSGEADNKNEQTSGNDLLDTLFADKEKALIILLIALLNEEKASSSLLLALMYLII